MRYSILLLLVLVACAFAQTTTTLKTSTKTTTKSTTTKTTTTKTSNTKTTTTKTSTAKTTTKVTTTKVSTTKTSTTKTSSTSKSSTAPTNAQTTRIPASAGVIAYPTARVISGNFDAGMYRYERNPVVCAGQKETNETFAMFILEEGAKISNAIIGASQAEGIHCRGTCTLENIWWADVCEDAATFRQTSGTSYVIGGGAFYASDKIFQFNGRGTVSISGFYANDYGKLIRACGDCTNNGGPRHVLIDRVIATDGAALCGINVNYGDTCRITNSCQTEGEWCDRYTGVEKGNGSSPKLGEGPDNISCFTTNVTEICAA